MAIASILTSALLTAWVPAQWPVYLAEGMAFAVAALWMALRIVRPGTVVLHPWLVRLVLRYERPVGSVPYEGELRIRRVKMAAE
jgi:hypothetical protein